MKHDVVGCALLACDLCDAYGAGWAAGKDKLAFEIEAVKDHPHGEGCGCRPCSLVRLVLGVPGCGATCDQPAVHLSGCWCHVHERDRSR